MTDPRHLKKVRIIQNLYASQYVNDFKILPYPDDPETKKILRKKNKIDLLITKYAPRFPLKAITKVDLAILRWAIFEIVFNKKLPYKVVINEAVELAKELSSQNSYSFINGVLGSLIKDYYEVKNKSL